MSKLTMNLLLVDDESAIRKAIGTSLRAAGYDVEEAASGEAALRSLLQYPSGIVLLDINMPGMGGIEACHKIRELAPKAGIVMITVRDSEDDKIQALDAGADDYVTKPFRFRELLARVRAVGRRTGSEDTGSMAVLRAGALELDRTNRLFRKDGQEIHLSPKEFDLLAYLMCHSGGLIPHAKLLQAVWGPEYGNELEYLRTYMRTLRRKIEDDPACPRYLLTEHWAGYRFCSPDA